MGEFLKGDEIEGKLESEGRRRKCRRLLGHLL